ncbi:hypothetical protein HYH03_015295 [Edaphochlamys debaryana]|uniref:Chitin-binding type-2 domain-containing protein n=1 Tax=Edaphochlamys debaryana TaxID=47281 RepID=A0A835XJM7_9CHLO|nr:hypothetical protein HYH03_015295 [Edaphochlamys debaryana]|eukprot:KAG2485972.1 hypothetical protein HYH03_015295 [Edaphochlamys debaryana]
MPCPSGLHFNAALQVCDWPSSAGCTVDAAACSDDAPPPPPSSPEPPSPEPPSPQPPSPKGHGPIECDEERPGNGYGRKQNPGGQRKGCGKDKGA